MDGSLEEASVFSVVGNLLNLPCRYAEPKAESGTGVADQLDFSALSSMQVAALKTAAGGLDLSATRQIVAALQATHPELAGRINDLVQGFRFDRIIEFCLAASQPVKDESE